MSSSEKPEGVRLQKVLAAAGVASRRVCEDMIVAGQVKVNGKVVTELGTRINPETDKVIVKGTPIQLDVSKVYLMLNKPLGVVSSMQDEHGRPDLSQYVIDYDRVFNVGRLDADTTGLLLLTNDGDVAHKLMHPSFEVPKTYQAKVHGQITQPILNKLVAGIELEDGPIKADKARLISASGNHSLVEIELHSGKNRIVRRMFDSLGFPVVALVRRQFGPLHLGHLNSGHIRQLTKIELGALLKAADQKRR
jgi:23S rRNA pseudouridine2605 synthase